MKLWKSMLIKWIRKQFKIYIKNYQFLKTEEHKVTVKPKKDLINLLKTRIKLCLFTKTKSKKYN